MSFLYTASYTHLQRGEMLVIEFIFDVTKNEGSFANRSLPQQNNFEGMATGTCRRHVLRGSKSDQYITGIISKISNNSFTTPAKSCKKVAINCRKTSQTWRFGKRHLSCDFLHGDPKVGAEDLNFD